MESLGATGGTRRVETRLGWDLEAGGIGEQYVLPLTRIGWIFDESRIINLIPVTMVVLAFIQA